MLKTSKAQLPAVADDLSLFTVTPRLSSGDGLGRRGRASHAEASDYAPPDKDRISSPPVSNDYIGAATEMLMSDSESTPEYKLTWKVQFLLS